VKRLVRGRGKGKLYRERNGPDDDADVVHARAGRIGRRWEEECHRRQEGKGQRKGVDRAYGGAEGGQGLSLVVDRMARARASTHA
jgi:hypothetical protein